MTIVRAPALETVARLVDEAVAEHKAGRADAAKRLYTAALHVSPTHPEANHNLALLLLHEGDGERALRHFRTALENDAERELYWLSFARALLLAGRRSDAARVLKDGEGYVLDRELVDAFFAQAGLARSQEELSSLPSLAAAQARAFIDQRDFPGAVKRLRSALQLRPGNGDELLLLLGEVLVATGDVPGAKGALKNALALNPALADAHFQLGAILSENGDVAGGFSHFMQRAALVHRGTNASGRDLRHKVKHDAEQRAYLVERGIVRPHEPSPFHIGDGSRIPGGTLNQPAGRGELRAQWEAAAPQFLVVDDFLVPEAVQKLRTYCAESTVWKRVYDAGYIGATPEDGFACPLLAQIAEEIQSAYISVIGEHPFRYLGAFKYDSELSTGTNTHADFSAINVNLYIAPDGANLSPETGGMIIWDKRAVSEQELRRMNGNEHALRKFLERSGATAHRISHRANRAVIFASSLFHRTDDCNFLEGYLNKRINVSLLYGDWSST